MTIVSIVAVCVNAQSKTRRETESISSFTGRPRSGQLASQRKIEPWDGDRGLDATQPAEGRARMCKDALLQVKEK